MAGRRVPRPARDPQVPPPSPPRYIDRVPASRRPKNRTTPEARSVKSKAPHRPQPRTERAGSFPQPRTQSTANEESGSPRANRERSQKRAPRVMSTTRRLPVALLKALELHNTPYSLVSTGVTQIPRLQASLVRKREVRHTIPPPNASGPPKARLTCCAENTVVTDTPPGESGFLTSFPMQRFPDHVLPICRSANVRE